jgi:hypothetical protein
VAEELVSEPGWFPVGESTIRSSAAKQMTIVEESTKMIAKRKNAEK